MNLHNLVTKEFLTRIKSGDATTQDLKVACDWLKTNDISGVAMESSPLANFWYAKQVWWAAFIISTDGRSLANHKLLGVVASPDLIRGNRNS